MILNKEPWGKVKYKLDVNGQNIDTAWGSLYYKSFSIPTDIDCRGKQVIACYVPSSGSSGWAMIDSITANTINILLIRPFTGTATGTIYIEVA